MTIQDVGAQDPELRNSPIAEEALEPDDPTLSQDAPEDRFCYFNGERFQDGTVVRSGTAMLRCDRGMWIPAGPGDPDNP
jgi:hypothetical protein